MTRVRNFEDVRFGEYLIKTWYVASHLLESERDLVPSRARHEAEAKSRYYSPYPQPTDGKPDGTSAKEVKRRRVDSQSSDHPVSGRANSRAVAELFAGLNNTGSSSRRLWVCDVSPYSIPSGPSLTVAML